ncbi:cadherin-15-like [Lampetra fluviatilis]
MLPSVCVLLAVVAGQGFALKAGASDEWLQSGVDGWWLRYSQDVVVAATSVSGGGRVKRAWVIPPISVAENLPQRSLPKFLVQIKSDKQANTTIIYSVKGVGVDLPPTGVFRIDKASGNIYLEKPLDREERPQFRIKAYALDAAGKSVEEAVDLDIIVVDMNDNRPVFNSSVFVGHVRENSEPGALVMRVGAFDADDPNTDNGDLRFSISDQSPEQPEASMFSIDPHTGDIRTVTVGLDREAVASYNLTLQVSDMAGGPAGLVTTATAIVHVDDVNDNGPRFTQSSFMAVVGEGDVGRAAVLAVRDEDVPGTPAWRARYRIAAGDPGGLFTVDTDPETNAGILTITQPLDYETSTRYVLTVVAENEAPLETAAAVGDQEEGASAAASSAATVTVYVQDRNEAPAFPESPRRVALGEHTRRGDAVARYAVTDPDHIANQKITYSVAWDPAGWLDVDVDTGDIAAKRDFDKMSGFLEGGVYSAVIMAEDDGIPPHTATGTLHVTLLEQNDFAPALSPRAGVLCHERAKGEGLLLQGWDADLAPQAAPFHFAFHPDFPEFADNFTITPVNGTHALLQLRVEQVREGDYELPLVLSDSGSPALADSPTLNLTVCTCDAFGDCVVKAFIVGGPAMGLSTPAILAIIFSIIALLLLVLCIFIVDGLRDRLPLGKSRLFGASDDDIRDNILNYNEQGGGEEDQDAFDVDQLRNPDAVAPDAPMPGQPRQRKDTPSTAPPPQHPRRPPSDPSDMEDFINQSLDTADGDPTAPPYDSYLLYDYEGEGSTAGSLSSLQSSSTNGDQDYDHLSDWGPRFNKLADMYSSGQD